MDSFTTDLAPIRKRETEPQRTTFDEFEAASWTPAGEGMFMTFPDLFDYHGDYGVPGEAEAFEFTCKPVADGFEMTATHTVKASHLEDLVSEVATLDAATKEIRSILKEWDYQVSRSNDEYDRQNDDEEE